MDNVIHLGDECLEAYFVADYLLDRGYIVSVVGHGPSMGKIIPDKTRMVLQPVSAKTITIGDAVFNRIGQWGYNVHKVAKMRRIPLRGTEYLITDADEKARFGWVKPDQILGKYIGRMEDDTFVAHTKGV